MTKLGVNIDHVATLRQARKENEPCPLSAVPICEKAGANSIVAHLREDRRHIQDQDILALRKTISTSFNMEMSIASSIVDITCRIKPDQATLVPERRQEITTEGGLNVLKYLSKIKKASEKLTKAGIVVSLFIDPDIKQIKATHTAGIPMIEIHTGTYALAKSKLNQKRELDKIRRATDYAKNLGLKVAAGHGLKYHNTAPIAAIKGIEELNIGHSIVSRAVFVGLAKAVREMKTIIRMASQK